MPTILKLQSRHGSAELSRKISTVKRRSSTTAQVNVTLDKEEGTLKVVLPNGNQAEGHYVTTTNVLDRETLYLLNTGGTLIAELSVSHIWVSTVDRVVVRERNGQYNLAFNIDSYATCTVVP